LLVVCSFGVFRTGGHAVVPLHRTAIDSEIAQHGAPSSGWLSILQVVTPSRNRHAARGPGMLGFAQ
jgi:hypothetical protein